MLFLGCGEDGVVFLLVADLLGRRRSGTVLPPGSRMSFHTHMETNVTLTRSCIGGSVWLKDWSSVSAIPIDRFAARVDVFPTGERAHRSQPRCSLLPGHLFCIRGGICSSGCGANANPVDFLFDRGKTQFPPTHTRYACQAERTCMVVTVRSTADHPRRELCRLRVNYTRGWRLPSSVRQWCSSRQRPAGAY